MTGSRAGHSYNGQKISGGKSLPVKHIVTGSSGATVVYGDCMIALIITSWWCNRERTVEYEHILRRGNNIRLLHTFQRAGPRGYQRRGGALMDACDMFRMFLLHRRWVKKAVCLMLHELNCKKITWPAEMGIQDPSTDQIQRYLFINQDIFLFVFFTSLCN